jgi:hypothetical protein
MFLGGIRFPAFDTVTPWAFGAVPGFCLACPVKVLFGELGAQR